MKTLLFIIAIFAFILLVDADISFKFYKCSFRLILNDGGIKQIKQDDVISDSLYQYKDWYCVDSPKQKALQTIYSRSQDFLDTIEKVPNNSVTIFIEANKESVINSWQHGVLPSVKMAQAIIESASGTSDICKNANNFFGVKCHSCDTTYNGWRFFKDKESSFSYLDRLYNRMGRYKHLIGEKNIFVWCTQLRECGYATSKSYPQSLMYNIQLYDLYKLDEIAFNKFHNKII